jgi:hypothetical protein
MSKRRRGCVVFYSFSIRYYGRYSHHPTCKYIRKNTKGTVATFHHPRGIQIKAKPEIVEIAVVIIFNHRYAPAGVVWLVSIIGPSNMRKTIQINPP